MGAIEREGKRKWREGGREGRREEKRKGCRVDGKGHQLNPEKKRLHENAALAF